MDRQRLLNAWDRGVALGPSPQRPLAILRAFGTGRDGGELEAMTVGERDHALLDVRRRLFGDRLVAFARCAACDDRLEIVADAGAFVGGPAPVRPSCVTVRTDDGLEIVARAPTVADLEVASHAVDARSAQAIILRRCVVSVRRAGDGDAVAIDELSASAVDALGAELEAIDPEAHIELEARCPSCRHASRHTLDVAAFVWAEIEAESLRLLRDVHRLARGYGWRESDILALSTVRRRAYMALLPS